MLIGQLSIFLQDFCKQSIAIRKYIIKQIAKWFYVLFDTSIDRDGFVRCIFVLKIIACP